MNRISCRRIAQRLFSVNDYSSAAVQLYAEANETLSTGGSVAKAMELYEKAGEAGHDDAWYQLGELYERGELVTRNLTTAFDYYNRSAVEGNDRGQVALAWMYESGVHVEKNDALALLYYHFAAMSGNVAAQMALGYRYEFGIGVPRSCVTAAEYYLPVATKVLEDHDRLGIRHPARTRLPLTTAGTLGDEDVLEYYEHVADEGDARAQVMLAHLHYHGNHGVQRDQQRAVQLFRAAAAQGDTGAMANLGHMYAHGFGVAQDNDTALKLYQEAAEKGNAGAMTGLGVMYMNGLGVEKRQDKALQYFEQAAKEGYPDAQYNLALMHAEGYATPRNPTLAIQLFNAAASQHHTGAMYRLAVAYLSGIGGSINCPAALPLLKSVAEKGPWGDILDEAGKDYQHGHYEKALYIFDHAASLGFESAQNNAAYMLTAGEGCRDVTEEERFARSLRLYTLSAEQGNTHAFIEVGDAHYYGKGTVSNHNVAVGWYRRAADARHAQAAFNIGYAHHTGDGAVLDLHQAKKYYDMALVFSRDAAIPCMIALYLLRLSFIWEARYQTWEVVKGYLTKWDSVAIACLVVFLATLVLLRLNQRNQVPDVNEGNDGAAAEPAAGDAPLAQ